jgi:hypothetical protein
MKPPYFPEPTKPKEASPYREADIPAGAEKAPPAVVASRPEPLREDEPPAKPLEATTATSQVTAETTRLEARALLAVHRNQHKLPIRTRLLLLPVTLGLWRLGGTSGAIGWLVYVLLAISLVLVVLEVRRVWRRTAL